MSDDAVSSGVPPSSHGMEAAPMESGVGIYDYDPTQSPVACGLRLPTEIVHVFHERREPIWNGVVWMENPKPLS